MNKKFIRIKITGCQFHTKHPKQKDKNICGVEAIFTNKSKLQKYILNMEME